MERKPIAVTLIDFDTTRYIRAKRSDVLDLLDEAGLTPDKLTAHRDRTYTACYTRDQLDAYATAEKRLQSLDGRVAIFKRPSDQLDRGQYLTFKFALADTAEIGIPASSNGSAEHQPGKTGKTALMTRLNGITRDMRHLTDYAHEIAASYHTHSHLAVTLEEMKKQVELLQDGLKQLANPGN